MGYTIKIGSNLKGNYVESEKHDNAPAFGEPTDFTNERWPSYVSWHESCVFCGIDDLMFNKENGLLINHPGIVTITKYHVDKIKKACDDFYKKYPNCVAGYSSQDEDCYAVRLEWLKYWIIWAFENCENPSFYNS